MCFLFLPFSSLFRAAWQRPSFFPFLVIFRSFALSGLTAAILLALVFFDALRTFSLSHFPDFCFRILFVFFSSIGNPKSFQLFLRKLPKHLCASFLVLF